MHTTVNEMAKLGSVWEDRQSRVYQLCCNKENVDCNAHTASAAVKVKLMR